MQIVGCKCGKHKIKKEFDEDYSQWYCQIECKECGYYWEGYISSVGSDE